MSAKKEIWQEHEVLYHYTSEEALKSILRSQTLWATHYKFLNDPTEIEQMKNVLVAIVTPEIKQAIRIQQRRSLAARLRIKKSGGLNVVAATQSEEIIDVLYRVTFGENTGGDSFAEPYIVSFCSHDNDRPYTQENGLLSQWRGYGRDSGCAIIFDCKRLAEVLKDKEDENYYSSGSIGDVVYEGNDERFQDEFSSFLEELQKYIKGVFTDGEEDLRNLFPEFINSASRFKHQAFEEEREVRIISSPMTKRLLERLKQSDPDAEIQDKPLKKIYRRKHPENKNAWVPYIKLFESIDDELLPIRKIIIGPGRDQSYVEQRTRILVAEIYGESKVEIQSSKTPFGSACGR